MSYPLHINHEIGKGTTGMWWHSKPDEMFFHYSLSEEIQVVDTPEPDFDFSQMLVRPYIRGRWNLVSNCSTVLDFLVRGGNHVELEMFYSLGFINFDGPEHFIEEFPRFMLDEYLESVGGVYNIPGMEYNNGRLNWEVVYGKIVSGR